MGTQLPVCHLFATGGCGAGAGYGNGDGDDVIGMTYLHTALQIYFPVKQKKETGNYRTFSHIDYVR